MVANEIRLTPKTYEYYLLKKNNHGLQFRSNTESEIKNAHNEL